MRVDPETCRDPDLLAAEVRRLRAVIAECDPPPASDGSVGERLVERLRGGWPYRGMDARILCEEAAAEIERLRLTDAEREILPVISKTCRGRGWRDWSDVIDGLLERLGFVGDAHQNG